MLGLTQATLQQSQQMVIYLNKYVLLYIAMNVCLNRYVCIMKMLGSHMLPVFKDALDYTCCFMICLFNIYMIRLNGFLILIFITPDLNSRTKLA